MEINETGTKQPIKIQQLNHHRHSQDSDSQQSDLDSPSLAMAMVLNDSNPYWANDAALRCASNAELASVGGKCRRDFKFQVIQVVQSGPKWFIFPNKNEGNHDLVQSPVCNNSDQENQREPSGIRRSVRSFINRRKTSNEFNKQSKNNFIPFEDELCKATATNQVSVAPLSEPTTRRINTKAMAPIDCRFQVTKTSLSVSPPSTSSDYSSNQSTLSSCNSDTFQILSVAKKWENDQDETEEDSNLTNPADTIESENLTTNPKILISSANEEKQ